MKLISLFHHQLTRHILHTMFSSRLTMPEVATTAALAGVTLVSAYAYSLLTRRLGGRAAGLGAAAAVVYDQAGHVVPAWEGAESASGTCPGAG
jgi:hypothetical protein